MKRFRVLQKSFINGAFREPGAIVAMDEKQFRPEIDKHLVPIEDAPAKVTESPKAPPAK